jgi:hypothetical protein
MKLQFLAAAVLLCCVWQSCNIINPKEKVPTYIRLDSFSVKTNDYSRTGSVSSKITGAWVYVNNSLIGAFEIPSTVPIIIDNKSTVSIAPGIDFGGLKNYMATYPFYTFDTFQVSPSNGSIITHSGVIKYSDAANFRWIGDFETGNKFQKVNTATVSDTSMVRISSADKVFEGGASGYIYMDSNHPTSENISTDDITIPSGEAYLEVNYKCNTTLNIGLQTVVSGDIKYEYLMGIKPNENWNKLYLNLSSFTGKYKGTAYHIMIKSGLQDGQSNAYVLFDNFKVVTY